VVILRNGKELHEEIDFGILPKPNSQFFEC
jgi:hypothetical protein